LNIQTHDSNINSAAADWDARLRSHRCTDADRSEFKAWCDQDQRHREAFDRLQRSLAALRQAADHPQIRALREMATIGERGFSARRIAWGAAIAASIAGVFVIAAYRAGPGIATWQQPTNAGNTAAVQPAFVTAADELRTVTLPDGSSVTMNAGTQIQTAWLPGERGIRLLSGQAFFRVAKDPTRPFVVTAANHTVTALGTAFDVKLETDKVQVTLVEGRVAVRGIGKAAGQPMTELAPHEQLAAADGALPTVRAVDVAMSVGWAEDQVFFTDESLARAVAEMNRHSAEQIVLDDPSLARYQVNGMFLAGNQRGFVSALSTYYPIEYRRDARGRIVLTRRQDSPPSK
jgi:transmembrane sensor